MDSQTLDAFQQKWEAVAGSEPAATGVSEKVQRQQRLSLACTLAKEYLALGLPPPPSTAALTGADSVASWPSERRVKLYRTVSGIQICCCLAAALQL